MFFILARSEQKQTIFFFFCNITVQFSHKPTQNNEIVPVENSKKKNIYVFSFETHNIFIFKISNGYLWIDPPHMQYTYNILLLHGFCTNISRSPPRRHDLPCMCCVLCTSMFYCVHTFRYICFLFFFRKRLLLIIICVYVHDGRNHKISVFKTDPKSGRNIIKKSYSKRTRTTIDINTKTSLCSI